MVAAMTHSTVANPGRWVLLAYRLPRVPSTPRIALWRTLRRLGASQLLDGLVALPCDSRTREQLEWLAEEIVGAGGDATIWIAQPGSAAQERGLAQRMRAAVAADYEAVAQAAVDAETLERGPRKRTLARLRRELRRIRRRDYFPAPEREQAVAATDRLAGTLEEAVA